MILVDLYSKEIEKFSCGFAERINLKFSWTACLKRVSIIDSSSGSKLIDK